MTSSTDGLVLGLDFGTDSVRALLCDTTTGAHAGLGIGTYQRWAEGRYCDLAARRFRQHPSDHREALVAAVHAALTAAGPEAATRVCGLALDATGSSPLPLDAQGRPLADDPAFADAPAAQCWLWKDQTAQAEAARLTSLAAAQEQPCTTYSGGDYSPEWFWAKIAHARQEDPAVAQAAATWVEHGDWLAWMLCGGGDPRRIPRNRCAAGHKALWHADWGGFPPADVLAQLDPALARVRASLSGDCVLPGSGIGSLAPDWAGRLGLPAGLPIAAGALDAHLGAVGAGIRPGRLVLVMGTSSCAMAVTAAEDLTGSGSVIPGISGQVDGSILPGLIGLEAGQSAFGDVYAWFEDLLGWQRQEPRRLLADLDRAAAGRPPAASGLLALDFLNGRRSPDLQPDARGALWGLRLGHDAVDCYRALVEATAYGVRAIVDRYLAYGVRIDEVVAVGGIADKSRFVVQTVADVLDRPLTVAGTPQAGALGAGMLAACLAGLHPRITAAQAAMLPAPQRQHRPEAAAHAALSSGYRRYLRASAQAVPG
ncbi:MAG: ribulokinase [Planctomycetota bacterium]